MEVVTKLINTAIRRPRMWVLTGAGISTESGIPDFRSPGSGLWETVNPMEVFSVEGLARNPGQFYDMCYKMFDGVLQAPANQAHLVLGQLQQWGLIGPIVTQNIDNLHQKGGAFWMYEVHGHVRTATCMGCGRTQAPMREVLEQAASGDMPRCMRCKALLKPDVILFGDAMPPDYINACVLKNAYRNHSLSILVVGSSLVVAPINSLPMDFDELAIINNDQTMLDYKADLLWRDQAGHALAGVYEYICQQVGSKDPQRLPYGFLPGAVISDTLDKCLDASGQPKNLSADKAGIIYAEACLWQEALNDYQIERGSKGIAGMVTRSLLDMLEPICEAYRTESLNLDRTRELAQAGVLRLAQDHLEAAEVYMRSRHGEASEPQVKELLLGTALGSLGWYQWLTKKWGGSEQGTEALQRRPLNRGYANQEDIIRLIEEY
ncbi:MAG: Sir2 family NAD-dependent protein deacetylase [Methylocystaceae bacterium]